MKRLFLLAYFFVLMNWAAVLALFNFVGGRHDVWKRTNT